MKKTLLLIVFTIFILIYFSTRAPRDAATQGSRDFVQGSLRLANLLSADALEGYARASGPRTFTFPEDHGPHPDFRNEWWYVTGNLDSEKNERFGFEFTLFRFSVAPDVARDESAWRSNQVYLAHFAITDVTNKQFHVAQRFSRGSLGLAGARAKPFRVWLDDWELSDAFVGLSSAALAATEWHLRATDKAMAIDLTLIPESSPVLNGSDGLSQKSSAPGNASYYYSIPRLQTNGTLRVGNDSYRVSGLAWLDREWGSGGLSADQAGWDWFALQLSDGSNLMFYHLRRKDGTRDPHSAGTFVAEDGNAIQLSADDIRIEVLDHWDSPQGGRYPMAWQLSIASLELKLRITPVMTGQELATLVRYWEGAVDAAGYRGENHPISGRGYVELTGYAGDIAHSTTNN